MIWLEEFARDSFFGGPAASGWHTAGLSKCW
jgi:acyl dehydratase